MCVCVCMIKSHKNRQKQKQQTHSPFCIVLWWLVGNVSKFPVLHSLLLLLLLLLLLFACSLCFAHSNSSLTSSTFGERYHRKPCSRVLQIALAWQQDAKKGKRHTHTQTEKPQTNNNNNKRATKKKRKRWCLSRRWPSSSLMRYTGRMRSWMTLCHMASPLSE